MTRPRRLFNYLAPSAPGTRRKERGDEPWVRPEIGFVPSWFHQRAGVCFGERWHADPAYRRESLIAMTRELDRAFPGAFIGRMGEKTDDQATPDLLTGTLGACAMAGIYGMEIVYADAEWPDIRGECLTDEQVDRLKPPNLDENPLFQNLMKQVDWIARHVGVVKGFVNWQGVLNTAFRLRGLKVFTDMVEAPERTHHLFSCIHKTMEEGARRLHERQRQTGFPVDFFTVSNCVVNMISPGHYREYVMPWDRRFGKTFGCLGVHNCAWTADPYLEDYASLPNVAYIDMGADSDLEKARWLFSEARRALMIPPTYVTQRSLQELRRDVEGWVCRYGPCDLVFADLDCTVPDCTVRGLLSLSNIVVR